MTIEQALEIKQKWTSEQARNDLEKLLLRGEKPADKVVALACKALEKQIPKKVKTENGYFECPYCQTDIEIDKGKSYCVVCGQTLDWSDENENT